MIKILKINFGFLFFIIFILLTCFNILQITTKPLNIYATSDCFNSIVFGTQNNEPEQIKVITNKANVYAEADINSSVLYEAQYGEIFLVQVIENNFYKISFDDNIGYILIAYVLDINIKSPKIYLDTNAIVTHESKVYSLEGYAEVSDIVLFKETRVKVLNGYDIDKQYCKISFLHNDEVVTYYISTSNITSDGVSTRTIISITLMIVCVFIFLILYSFFRGKKTTIREK
ncbi:MAG: SH3 domain-containing protein [Clostridia bacterium]|nr:SH3 domain-containing protein [Clostridia bacterium]